MSEKRERYEFPVIDSALTRRLIANPTDSAILNSVEESLQAYIDIRPEVFAGFMYHPHRLGPEKAYFFPDEQDNDPLIQATARLGVQHKYWDMVFMANREQVVNPKDWQSTTTFLLDMQPNGSSRVMQLNKDKVNEYSLQRVAESKGHTKPKFNTYAFSINYGGDADFYGPGEGYKQIFPTVYFDKKIVAADLGIEQQDVISTYESWKDIFDASNTIFTRAFHNGLKQNSTMQTIFEDIPWQNIQSSLDLTRKLSRQNVDWDVIDEIDATLYHDMGQLGFDGSELTLALKQHAADLGNLYVQAKEHLGSEYKYE